MLLDLQNIQRTSRCLKITEKVLFNIASEATYVSLKMPKIKIDHFLKDKNATFWVIFKQCEVAAF